MKLIVLDATFIGALYDVIRVLFLFFHVELDIATHNY